MENTFKEKCEVCGIYTNDFITTSNGHLMCSECYKETRGKLELDEPEQLTMDPLIYQEESK